MIIHEYGKNNKKVIVILHDDQSVNWEKNDGLSDCGENYHIVAVSLGADEKEEVLTQYLKDYYNNQVYAICAFHNEWNVCTYLMKNKELDYEKIIVEENTRESGRMIKKYICQM